MAGFFGIGNFEKEGPGVSKDAPKKKTFFQFFEIYFRNFWRFIPINLVYSLISLPLITNGLANAGLANVTRNIARDKHSFGLSDFKDTIKKNWKQALVVGIINLFVFGILITDLFMFNAIEGIGALVALGITMGLLIIFTMMEFYIWTLMVTFSFTVRQLYSTSFKLVCLNLKSNFLYFFFVLSIYGAFIALPIIVDVYFLVIALIEILIGIIILPAFRALLIQYCVFPAIIKFIINPYYEENPHKDIELRRSLGLYVEEKASKEDDTVFDDQITEDTNE